MVKIAPSILAADFTNLAGEIKKVIKAGADLIHIDVMDGKFVENTTPGIEMYHTAVEVSTIPIDTHLMVENPMQWVKENVILGQSQAITFHIEAVDEEEVSYMIEQLHQNSINVGIAIKPATPIEALLPYLDKIDMVLVMTVEPGWGGQPLIPQCLEKVRVLRDRNKTIDIEVDGGINLTTHHLAKEAGANILVAGTAIFGAKSMNNTIVEMKGK